ncbi:hypothetical protein OROHE_003939 [Orobanche hederae]
MDIVDPSLLLEGVDAAGDDDDDDDRYHNDITEIPIRRHQDRGPPQARKLEECLISIMQIGIACSTSIPTDRMLMDVVVNKMKATRDSYLNACRSEQYTRYG